MPFVTSAFVGFPRPGGRAGGRSGRRPGAGGAGGAGGRARSGPGRRAGSGRRGRFLRFWFGLLPLLLGLPYFLWPSFRRPCAWPWTFASCTPSAPWRASALLFPSSWPHGRMRLARSQPRSGSPHQPAPQRNDPRRHGCDQLLHLHPAPPPPIVGRKPPSKIDPYSVRAPRRRENTTAQPAR